MSGLSGDRMPGSTLLGSFTESCESKTERLEQASFPRSGLSGSSLATIESILENSYIWRGDETRNPEASCWSLIGLHSSFRKNNEAIHQQALRALMAMTL